jgi:hypothetical protein
MKFSESTAWLKCSLRWAKRTRLKMVGQAILSPVLLLGEWDTFSMRALTFDRWAVNFWWNHGFLKAVMDTQRKPRYQAHWHEFISKIISIILLIKKYSHLIWVLRRSGQTWEISNFLRGTWIRQQKLQTFGSFLTKHHHQKIFLSSRPRIYTVRRRIFVISWLTLFCGALKWRWWLLLAGFRQPTDTLYDHRSSTA